MTVKYTTEFVTGEERDLIPIRSIKNIDVDI